MMTTEVIRRSVNTFKMFLTNFFVKLNIKPNTVTVLGPFFALVACGFLILGQWRWGAVWCIAMGACDVLDGQIAKARGTASKYGAFLDATMDRISDGFVYLGFIVYFAVQDQFLYVILSFIVLLGSSVTSYARARAELHIPKCAAGFWERPERLVIVIIGLLCGHIPQTLWLLAITTPITALHRIWITHEELENRPAVWREWKGPLSFVRRVVFWEYKRYSVAYDIYCTVCIVWVVWPH